MQTSVPFSASPSASDFVQRNISLTLPSSFKNYVNKHGNFTHILSFDVQEAKDEAEKNEILSAIYALIHENTVTKTVVEGISVSVTWRCGDETDLSHYFTDTCGIFGDKAVQLHTQQLWKDILEQPLLALSRPLANGDENARSNNAKVSISLTKPLTKPVCMV